MRCCFCGKDFSKELSTGEIRGGLGNKELYGDCYRKYMLLQQNCSILKYHARHSKDGKMGEECIVPKTLLADAAERLEALSKLDKFIDRWNAI